MCRITLSHLKLFHIDFPGGRASFLFKVCDPASEHMHRIHSHPRQLGVLEAAVRAKLSLASDAKITLRYDDDEGDRVAIATNDELAEAVGAYYATDGLYYPTMLASLFTGRTVTLRRARARGRRGARPLTDAARRSSTLLAPSRVRSLRNST